MLFRPLAGRLVVFAPAILCLRFFGSFLDNEDRARSVRNLQECFSQLYSFRFLARAARSRFLAFRRSALVPSVMSSTKPSIFFDQRACAAFLAESIRCCSVNFLARAAPPFLPSLDR